MKGNKVLKTMVIVLAVIALSGTAALVAVMNLTGKEKQEAPSADELADSSIDIPEMTTNLADGRYIKISFKIQTDSDKGKEEVEKRDFQIKDAIIEQLSEMKAADFKGKEGMAALKEQLKQQINALMQEGKVENVYITSFILQ
ncbi:flagellar basal body-associated protein FliL [Geobacillus stearothermophilus]|uniref:flagellar basal body-associated protein FliL n=1 Tax=Geobacillus stearothermophilus TaxID=1422 RepID=UPI0006ABF6E9|nr:flagellar basal body-associated protein FliL [Geobacillus stearothermophilus]KOR94535.1 flagellar basal body-associated protein FliL [Geobacillus stearothermophilus ATCC 12980]MED3722435.1 flagellar basal body-associated protein FliL [Geobacillus stearothermophilus]MED3748011.1 flagellar basal body-associated protein FliL [Geobacillus stearothermophilus]MED3753455.1 flagellar basal body-associated protein FliL [Geobacillus stearothermophilus]MED3770322.1 flagellar basal body-associated prot